VAWFEGFDEGFHEVNGVQIYARAGGRRKGPPLLLLHGFPQTHAIWHRIAQELQDRFFLVMPDLRGYGDSDKPDGLPDHFNYSKRAMAADMAALMQSLGHTQYAVVGHDRGGRVAHRLALDHPQAVEKLMLIDIAPTLDMYDATDMRFASYYYHWFHLIQPAPLPEKMIGGDPAFYLHWKLGGWGSGGHAFMEPDAIAEYRRCFCRAEAIHAACEDYRASAGIDLDHDRASRERGEKIGCNLRLLWGSRGIIEALFDPIGLWQAQCAGRVTGRHVDAGHFIPEELPELTTREIVTMMEA
jgi:haloacetate dehalogenase